MQVETLFLVLVYMTHILKTAIICDLMTDEVSNEVLIKNDNSNNLKTYTCSICEKTLISFQFEKPFYIADWIGSSVQHM